MPNQMRLRLIPASVAAWSGSLIRSGRSTSHAQSLAIWKAEWLARCRLVNALTMLSVGSRGVTITTWLINLAKASGRGDIIRADHHLTIAKAQPHPERDPRELVEAHV